MFKKVVQLCCQSAAVLANVGMHSANSCHAELVSASKRKYAFSLVEMLMALLVASLLLAALAPVMTKKMNESIKFEGGANNSPNPVKHRVVYLTETGDGEWSVPNGIRTFNVTTVAAGGGGGAGSNYGCVVFTTTATPSGSLLGDDNTYCEHVRSDSNASFTIPEGIKEIYVSMISGAGGGGGGSAKWASAVTYSTAGTYTWNVPSAIRGDRILVTMNGGGGGGGGADQGGGGGGASGGYVSPTAYNVAAGKTSIQVVVGGGGAGGYYTFNPGGGGSGSPAGGNGLSSTGGGGGGGASNFDNGVITAFGGGGGAGQLTANYDGWANSYQGGSSSFCGGSHILWQTVFNYGGSGRNGGTSGPYCGYGGTYGGIGGAGGGAAVGGNGGNGNVGTDGGASPSTRGGQGGAQSTTGQGKGGYGQDQWHGPAGVGVANGVGGGAGGGGGGSYFGTGRNAPTSCGLLTAHNATPSPKAGTGAGGAGASCGHNGGTSSGGAGGDGIVKINYLVINYGGTAGQAGQVVPRSRVALTNTMKSGSVLTITPGRGGKGGDRVIAYPNGNNIEIRTMNSSGVVNSTTDLSNAKGMYGTPSNITFNGTNIATTGTGSCGGGYQTNSSQILNCQTNECGTKYLNGNCVPGNSVSGWHGHQCGACTPADSTMSCAIFAGSTTNGGHSPALEWNGQHFCLNNVGGTISSRNGLDGSVARGGGGAYYGGFGGKGGDGYVKIEWGIPRNIDRTDALRYSGGGGSAGETITRKITVSPTVNKIRYRIGEGGTGGSFNINNNTMNDGGNGGDTVFGTITAKGGKGGKSANITSAYDSNFVITSLVGTFGGGGIAQCSVTNNCRETMNGLAGENNKGGKGGDSSTGIGANGGTGNNNTNLNGNDALNLDSNGRIGGGSGGGGGTSGNNSYGKGGKGANGYIKIEYDD